MGQALITRRGVPMLAPDVDDGYEQLINYTMLYDSGDECEEVTGGWEYLYANSFSYDSVIKGSDHIQIGTTSKRTDLAAVNKALDFTGYNTVYGHLERTAVASNSITKMNASVHGTDSYIGRVDVTDNDLYQISLENESNVDKVDIDFTAYLSVMKIYHVFLTKPDDYTTLCTKAGITAPSTLEDLIADTTSLATIFNSEDAAKFMVAQCTGDFMVGVLNDANAVEALKASPYLNLVVANVHWAKFMMMIPTAKELLGFTMLYDEGDECTDVTGGWGIDGWTADRTIIALTKNANSMSGTGTSSKYTLAGTINSVDLTEFSKMWAKIAPKTTSQYNGVSFEVKQNKGVTSSSIAALAMTHDGSIQIASDDISALSGAYYFANIVQGGAAYSVTIYNEFLTKSDDWQEWTSIAGVTGFSDMATLLADSTAMAKLMSNEEAVKYLMGCTGDLMVSILTSSVAVGAIVNSAYATEMLTSHPAWAKFIKMSPVCADAGLDLLV